MNKCALCGKVYKKLTTHHMHPRPYRSRHNEAETIEICESDHRYIHTMLNNDEIEMNYSSYEDLKAWYDANYPHDIHVYKYKNRKLISRR